MVILQDGIYWLQQFPQHPATILLRHRLGAWYDYWALEKRKEVASLIQNLPLQQVNALNTAAREGFHAVNQNVLTIQKDQQSMKLIFSSEIQYLKQKSDTIERTTVQIKQAVDQLVHDRTKAQALNVDFPTYTDDENENGQDNIESTDDHIPPVGDITAAQNNLHTESIGGNTINNMLRPVPLVPCINSKMPTCFKELLVQHRQGHLNSFQKANKGDWGAAL
jgi:hypothetical protein